MLEQSPKEILHYWFETLKPDDWWNGSKKVDDEISDCFGDAVMAAFLGELYRWRETPEGRLAEIICLDQFPRNIYRGTARAFAGDGLALILAQEAVLAGHDKKFEVPQRLFFLMPFMHSESLEIHSWAKSLFETAGLQENLKYLLEHTDVIRKYGRYPSRNEALNRHSTPAEIAYLKKNGKTWGQG